MQDLSTAGAETLYELAASSGIPVVGFRLPESRALSMIDAGGRCCIGIDNSKCYTAAEEKTMLAHELGHCRTGSFYDRLTPPELRRRFERRADEWAILHILPYDAIIRACRAGLRGSYELAEFFGVEEPLMKRAIDYYLRRKHDGAD